MARVLVTKCGHILVFFLGGGLFLASVVHPELDELIQRKNIIRFIKSQRLKWLGHVERMQMIEKSQKSINGSHLPPDQ